MLSLDARGHGSTTTTSLNGQPVECDLHLDSLRRDLVLVIDKVREKMGWESLPDIVLVGHSLGGSVVTDVAKRADLGSKLLAYAVLDVVEGECYVPLMSFH